MEYEDVHQETMVEEDDRETFPVALNAHFLLDRIQKDAWTTNDHYIVKIKNFAYSINHI